MEALGLEVVHLDAGVGRAGCPVQGAHPVTEVEEGGDVLGDEQQEAGGDVVPEGAVGVGEVGGVVAQGLKGADDGGVVAQEEEGGHHVLQSNKFGLAVGADGGWGRH